MIKLICVTPDNHNKFYYMEDLNNGYFKVTYGRVGNLETTLTYPICDWDKKYKEKIKKGYIDISEKISKSVSENSLNIENEDVKSLIKFLMEEAKQSIKRDYEIATESITKKQLDLVQENINTLKEKMLLKEPYQTLNGLLQKIYTTIPRKMNDTRHFFLKDNNYTQWLYELLQTEQQRLDTLRSQVNLISVNNKNNGLTLKELGFNCEMASDEDRKYISKNTDFRVNNQKIFKITNLETEKNFNPKHLKTKLLYHGSRNENFLSILQNGLKIRPKGVQTTGSMFGDGIYGANKARKSIGYTSLRGSYWSSGSSDKAYLAIFEFATGNEYNILKNSSYKSWMGSLNENKILGKGFDSVFAQGGADLRNDEYVIYNSNQCTIRYLIELTNEKIR